MIDIPRKANASHDVDISTQRIHGRSGPPPPAGGIMASAVKEQGPHGYLRSHRDQKTEKVASDDL